MNKKIISALAAGVLVLAACGSDSGGRASGAQGDAADAAIAAAKEEGVELDEDCVNDLAGKLSDEDAEAIVAAGPDGDADVSAEGEAIGTQLLGCLDNEQLIDLFVSQISASGQAFDEDCVRDGLKDLDLADLASSEEGDGAPTEVINAMFKCFELSDD